MVSSASTAIVGNSLQSIKADDKEDKVKLENAKKNQSSWIIGSAVLRLTKICAPKCLDYERVQVEDHERTCLDACVKSLHGVNESTMNFFRDFESDMKIKQKSLVEELASEAVNEKANQQSQVREERRREAGYVRM